MKKFLLIGILAIVSLSAGSSNHASPQNKTELTLIEAISDQPVKVDNLLNRLKQIR